jgi:hypothetical protein
MEMEDEQKQQNQRIIDMLTTLTTRINAIEDTIQLTKPIDYANELERLDEFNFDNDVLKKPSRKGSSTLHQAETYQPQNVNLTYTNTLQIPSFDNVLISLKPRAVIKFTAAAHTYEYTNKIKVNLSQAFQYEIQQQLVASSQGTYNASTIGTISLENFIKIARLHQQVYTQASFLKKIQRNALFPATPITNVDLITFPTFRNLIKQYSEEYLMLVDLFSSNVETIPPLNATKGVGLIWQFNHGIPFGFGTGLYNQIGFTNNKKLTFSTMNEYIELFNNKVDNLYAATNNVQPLFDAIMDATIKPRLPKPYRDKSAYANNNTNNFNNKRANINYIDDDIDSSDSSSMTSHSTGYSNDVNAFPTPPGQKTLTKDRPCHKMATEGACNKKECYWSHNVELVNAYRKELLDKLKKLDAT